MATRYTGRSAILAWSLCAGTLLLGALTVLSIGFIVLPIALLASMLAAWRTRIWPEAGLGALLGPAGGCALIAFLNLDYRPCEPSLTLAGPGVLSHCGGLNPVPWLLGATALGLTAFIAHRLWGRGAGPDAWESRGGTA